MAEIQDGTDRVSSSSQPWLHQHRGGEIQKFGTVKQFPVGLSYDARMYAGEMLNRTLADSQFFTRSTRRVTGMSAVRPSTSSTSCSTSTLTRSSL
jgi:hypothetical protein